MLRPARQGVTSFVLVFALVSVLGSAAAAAVFGSGRAEAQPLPAAGCPAQP
jgi:hypothetical protein